MAARFLIEEDEEQMRKELKEAFRFYDKEGEGFLTTDTLRGILLELEPSLDDAQLQDIIDEVDEDGSGTIDFDGKKKRSCSILCILVCSNKLFFPDRIHEHDDGLERQRTLLQHLMESRTSKTGEESKLSSFSIF